MIIGIKRVRTPQRDTLANLLEKYFYEISQYDNRPFNAQGLFNCENVDDYINEENHYAYFIYSNGRIAGFVLLDKQPKDDTTYTWILSHIFIAYLYRRKRIATKAMIEIFKHHVGSWQIKCNNRNKVGMSFCSNISQAICKSRVETVRTNDFYDGSLGKVFCFESIL